MRYRCQDCQRKCLKVEQRNSFNVRTKIKNNGNLAVIFYAKHWLNHYSSSAEILQACVILMDLPKLTGRERTDMFFSTNSSLSCVRQAVIGSPGLWWVQAFCQEQEVGINLRLSVAAGLLVQVSVFDPGRVPPLFSLLDNESKYRKRAWAIRPVCGCCTWMYICEEFSLTTHADCQVLVFIVN